jgi:hypothetical protein
MSDTEFPAALLDLIRRCTPTFPAVELLVLLDAQPEATWNVSELFEIFRQRGFSSAFISESLARFQRLGLVEELPENRFCYCPASADMAETVGLLKTAFNERPVSLIRAIYAIADHSIQSFSDSFRIKND